MSIRKEEAYQHALCMNISTEGFSYAVVSNTNKKVVHHQHFTVNDYSREAITPLLQEEVLSYDFASFVLAAGGKRNTLMPVDLFNHSKPGEIFRLNYAEPIDNIDYNRIPELGIVNIYELPIWLKSMMVIRFPRVKFVHPATVLLKGIFDQDNWGTKVHIYLDSESFYLMITSKNQLLYFNRFDFTTFADLVYHTLFVLEQKELEQSKAELKLYGVSDNWEQLAELQEFFKSPVQIASEKEQGELFLLAKQLLCV